MKKNVLFFSILLFNSFYLISQSLTPSILSVQGGINQFDGITIEWTLGENFTETITLGNKILTQGFHQTTLKKIKYENENPVSLINITTFPNPVFSILNIQLPKDFNTQFNINLFDINGNYIKALKVTENSSTIQLDMTYLATGVYILNISNSSRNIVESHRIIKY